MNYRCQSEVSSDKIKKLTQKVARQTQLIEKQQRVIEYLRANTIGILSFMNFHEFI